MSTDNDINHAADLQGMIDAQRRHSGAMYPAEIMEQYQAGLSRPINPVSPVVHVENDEPESSDLSPAVKRQLKAVAVIGPVVGVSAGLFHVVASGALNSFICWSIGCGVFASILSGLFSGDSRPRSGSGQSGETHYHYHNYYQNNNFGGSAGANQQNR